MPLHMTNRWRKGASWSRGETYVEDLPKTGMLSGIQFAVSGSCQSGATLATEEWKLLDFLDKVEIIGNGSEPIISADWRHLAYTTFLDQHKVTPGWWRNYATNTQFEHLLVLFGRHMWDREFGLDLSRWNRVEMRLTNSSSSTYHSASLSLTSDLLLMDEHAGGFPRGYLRKEEFREWTTVADTWEYVELPTMYPLRGVHLRLYPDVDANYVAETGMSNLAYECRFGINSRNRYLWNAPIGELMIQNYLDYMGEPLMSGHIDRTADYGFNMEVGRVFGWMGISGAKDGAVSATIPTIEADQTHVTQKLEAREADSPVHIAVRGVAPYNFVTMHYSRQAQVDELLTHDRHGQVTLDVFTRDAASAADGTNTVVVDQIVQR